jgi:hypothetical protein
VNSRQRKTLEDVFHEPTLANIRWDAAISMPEGLGGEVKDIGGSMKAVKLNGVRAVFHRPHPRNEMGHGLTRNLRAFLENAGISRER